MEAFANLFELCRSALYGLCLKRLEDTSLAEDAVQDVFIRTFASLPSFDRTRPFWPWLATIANRACIDLQRRRSFIHYSGDIGLAADADANNGGSKGEAGSALDEIIASEDRAELWESLKVLPKRQRRIFLLYAVDGWSCADIAAAEGISVGAVKLVLFRARRKMRAVRGGKLPALVMLPFEWMRHRFQTVSERITAVLGFYGDRLTNLGTGAAVTVGVAAVIAATGSSLIQPSVSKDLTLETTSAAALDAYSFGDEASKNGSNKKAAEAPVSSPGPADESPEHLVGYVSNPNQDATPEETSFSSMKASPNYEQDHTILALGSYSRAASVGTPVLFISTDGGATWKPRPSRLLHAGTLILPPDFVRRGRIFAYGAYGLQQSDDDGETFTIVSPIAGIGVAVLPGLGGSDFKILLGAERIFEFDGITGVTSPSFMNAPRPRKEHYFDLSYIQSSSSDVPVFVSDVGRVYRCVRFTCNGVNFSDEGIPRFQFDSRCNGESKHFAFTDQEVFSYTDYLRAFERMRFPSAFDIQDVAVVCGSSSNPFVFASANDALGSSPKSQSGVYGFSDSGESWSRRWVNLPGFEMGVGRLVATPSGRLIAGGLRSGLACSLDLGLTWDPRCPPEL